jgi:hypothetical protein
MLLRGSSVSKFVNITPLGEIINDLSQRFTHGYPDHKTLASDDSKTLALRIDKTLGSKINKTLGSKINKTLGGHDV